MSMSPGDDPASRTRYRFAISVRVRHPSMAPKDITEALGLEPKHCWEAGEPRRSPTGRLLAGSNRETYWTARVVECCAPTRLNNAVLDVLKDLVCARSFLHRIRAEGGTAELFIGWFFNSQDGDMLTHDCLALAGDLQIDLFLDVYPPDQSPGGMRETDSGSIEDFLHALDGKVTSKKPLTIADMNDIAAAGWAGELGDQ